MGNWSEIMGGKVGLWGNGVIYGERRGVGGQKRGVMGHWSESVGQRVRLWGEKWDDGAME